jgi:hypothetical protein
LSKTPQQHGIGRVELQVFLLDDFPDGFHVWYDYSTETKRRPLWKNHVVLTNFA